MEDHKNITQLLNQIPQPGFLVHDDHIVTVNPAAAAMMLAPGQIFSALHSMDPEDYHDPENSQLCLTLTIDGQCHEAVVIRTGSSDLVLLDNPEEQEEFRSMALASMELRIPLMQAITAARQMESGGDSAAAKINQSLMQMLRLVSNMSDINRYRTSTRMELRDVDAFLLELFEKAQTLTGSRARITYEGMAKPVFSQIDPEQLERAIWNILSNSLKFLPRDGRITAKLTRTGNMLRLTVTDNGSGIPEAVRSSLFSRYLRQPGIEDSRYGFGLGLAIVRAAASNHGGTILISNGKNGGTTVAMTLAIRHDDSNILRSPLLRPDYTGGWDHGLVELADCLDPDLYFKL